MTCIIIEAFAKKYGLIFVSYFKVNFSRLMSANYISLNSISRIQDRGARSYIGDCHSNKFCYRDLLKKVITQFFPIPFPSRNCLNLDRTIVRDSCWQT